MRKLTSLPLIVLKFNRSTSISSLSAFGRSRLLMTTSRFLSEIHKLDEEKIFFKACVLLVQSRTMFSWKIQTKKHDHYVVLSQMRMHFHST